MQPKVVRNSALISISCSLLRFIATSEISESLTRQQFPFCSRDFQVACIFPRKASCAIWKLRLRPDFSPITGIATHEVGYLGFRRVYVLESPTCWGRHERISNKFGNPMCPSCKYLETHEVLLASRPHETSEVLLHRLIFFCHTKK